MKLLQESVSRGGLVNRGHKNAFILNLVLTCCLVSYIKRVSGLIFERVFRKLSYITLFVRDANFYNAVILALHNATTSHACLLQTMKIAPAALAKPAKPISNMQVD